MTLEEIQQQVAAWSRSTFPDDTSDTKLKVLVGEVGELCEADAKEDQGILSPTDGHALVTDAVGDIVIALAGYCELWGLDLDACVSQAWAKVSQRDNAAVQRRSQRMAAERLREEDQADD